MLHDASAPSEKMCGSMLSFHRRHTWAVHAVSIIRPSRNGHDTSVPCVLLGGNAIYFQEREASAWNSASMS